jgi:hypothetical protein
MKERTMAKRDSYPLGDLFGVSPLAATSSIYPATQSTSPVLPKVSRAEEADSLLPWGCEQTDLVQPDLG